MPKTTKTFLDGKRLKKMMKYQRAFNRYLAMCVIDDLSSKRRYPQRMIFYMKDSLMKEMYGLKA